MAGQYVFTMLRLGKRFENRELFSNISISFLPGAKIGVVGDNGAGKSTLLRIMAGIDKEFDGEAYPEKGIKVGLVPQEPTFPPDKTVREVVEEAFKDIKALLAEYDDVSAAMGDPDADMDKLMERMGELQDAIDAVDGWDIDRHLEVAANALLLPPDEQKIGTLSGGELRRVALCKALLEKPDILLLDEPTNHLDAQTVTWLEEELKAYKGTVIIVTHDRYFLDNVTKWILELDNGRGIPFEGNYSSWLAQKLAILAAAEKKESPKRELLEHELRWIRMNSKDRKELSRQRISSYEELFVHAKAVNENSTLIEIPQGQRLGNEVLSFDKVSKSYPGGRPLISDLSFNLPKGAVVGVVGPNGAGKTTLMRLIAGEEAPDSGSVTLGETVDLAYVDQTRLGLTDSKTVWEEISDGKDSIILGGREVPSRGYVSRFNFKGTMQQKLVGKLSGGERNRVYLAKLLKKGGNFIMLDEPTNDLDVSALRMLEEAINAYSGCMLIISHDRFFLDRICTHLLVFEGGGKVRWFTGNFADYEEKLKEEMGDKIYTNRRRKFLAS